MSPGCLAASSASGLRHVRGQEKQGMGEGNPQKSLKSSGNHFGE
jgi:hypothetical protein